MEHHQLVVQNKEISKAKTSDLLPGRCHFIAWNLAPWTQLANNIGNDEQKDPNSMPYCHTYNAAD